MPSDAGLLLIKEFFSKIGGEPLIRQHFHTNDRANQLHTDDQNLLQKIYQQLAAYFNDDDSDELTVDPIFTAFLEKRAWASQPTMSRFLTAWMILP